MKKRKKCLFFSLLNASETVKNEAVSVLKEWYNSFTPEQLEMRELKNFKCIPQIIDAASGNYYKYCIQYTPSDQPKELDEIIAKYAQYHEKELGYLNCGPAEDAKISGDLLILIKSSGTPEDFISLYEKHSKSSRLHYTCHIDAMKIYTYLNMPEKAREAAVNFAKYGYGWNIEYTTIQPTPVLAYDFFTIFTKELFTELYHIPCCVDTEIKSKSPNLEATKFIRDMLNERPHELLKLSVPSGHLTAEDMCCLNTWTLSYCGKVTKGAYNASVFVSDKTVTAFKADFTDSPAVKYFNALLGPESQAEIDELENGQYFGFTIKSGIAVICDDKAKRELVKSIEKQKKKNKIGDISAEYLSFLNEKPYFDLTISEKEFHIPLLKVKKGCKGTLFWGYDKKDKICSVIIFFL